jgi:hypothetical protein
MTSASCNDSSAQCNEASKSGGGGNRYKKAQENTKSRVPFVVFGRQNSHFLCSWQDFLAVILSREAAAEHSLGRKAVVFKIARLIDLQICTTVLRPWLRSNAAPRLKRFGCGSAALSLFVAILLLC